jgi:hypothetical protein
MARCEPRGAQATGTPPSGSAEIVALVGSFSSRLLKRSVSPDVFEKIVWGTVHRLLRIPA